MKYSKPTILILIWLLVSSASVACIEIQPIDHGIRTQASPQAAAVSTVVSDGATALPPSPTAIGAELSMLITFQGEVSRGQRFEETLSEPLLFRLNPLNHGWEIWIGDRSLAEHNFSAVVTPPFRGVNARFVEGWHFRNSDNSGPNEAGEKNVNAPQYERAFCFVLNEDDYQTAYYGLNDQLLASEKEQQEIKEKYGLLQPMAGVLRITELELGNLTVNEQAWIEQMQFEVVLSLTDECSAQ